MRWALRLRLCPGLWLALETLGAPARAQPPPLPLPSEDSAPPSGAEPSATPGSRVVWHDDWHRFRASEAVVTGAMLLPIAGALFLYPEPDDNFHGGILFDDAVRNALVLDSRAARNRAAGWSNAPYLGLLAFPLLVDTALVTWGVHHSGDVALQMLAMDLEAYAIAGGIALTAQKLGRVRPVEKGCREDPSYSSKCGDPLSLNQSLLSGHTAIAFAGAGLTCAHHRNLPLYGGGAPDLLICLASLTAASAGGVLRIMSDDHYTSDVLLGTGLGLVTGYVLPEWLHYGSSNGGDEKPTALLPSWHPEGSTLRALLAPALDAGYAGVRVVGVY